MRDDIAGQCNHLSARMRVWFWGVGVLILLEYMCSEPRITLFHIAFSGTIRRFITYTQIHVPAEEIPTPPTEELPEPLISEVLETPPPDPRSPELGETVNRPEDVNRRSRIERFLTLAAAGNERLKEMLKDQETLNWLIGMVEKEEDGTEQYIAEQVLDAANRERLQALDINQRVEAAKKASTADIDAFVGDIETSKASLGETVTKDFAPDSIGDVLNDLADADRSALAARRVALTEAGRTVIRGASNNVKGTDLLAELQRYFDIVPNTERDSLSALLNNVTPVNDTVRDQALGILAEASALEALQDNTNAQTAKTDIQKQLDAIEGAKRLNVLKRFTERADFNNRFGGSNAETVLNFATIGGKIDLPVLKGQLEALGIDINDEGLRTALKNADVDIDVDGAVPGDWEEKKKDVISFLQNNGLNNPEGIQLGRVTEGVDATLPWFDSAGPDRVKGYTKNLAAMSAQAGGVWWKWIKSLPDNVIPGAEDADLLALQKQESDLEAALKTIKNLEDYAPDTAASMKGIYKKLTTLQDEIDTVSGSISPARGPSEEAEQAKMLLDAARTVMDELESTNFPIERRPRVRENAFRIAMTQGTDEAREYLNNPDCYAFFHPEHADDVLEFHDRVSKATDLGGRDILTPLHDDLGVKVQPNALSILSTICGPDGLPVNPDTIIADPDAARAILPRILYEDPATGTSGGIGLLVEAYADRKDVPGLTAVQADEYVRAIHRHLIRQIDDYNVTQRLLSKSNQSFDTVGGLRTAMDTLGGMLRSPDKAEKTLGWVLLAGGVYALYRGLQSDKWRPWLIGTGVFLGLNVAVERATGESILSRLNMNFMNKKDRNSALEEFIRKGADVEGYDELEEPAGREATRQLMNPKNPIPVAHLLHWHDKVKAGGRLDYSICAPDGLRTSRVSGLLGVSVTRNMNSKLRRQEGYRIMFLAFESLCISVAEANGLGGNDPKEKASKGAELIRCRYANRNEIFPASMGIDAAVKSAQGSCPDGSFGMLDVLIRERPTPAMRDALGLSTWPEYGLVKLGIAATAGKEQIEKGASWIEIKGRDLADKTPAALDAAKTYGMESFESFMDWARPTVYKASTEVEADMRALYDFLTGITMETGIIIREKGPDAIEWTYNKGVDISKFTKGKALDVYRELHRHQITGNMLVGFETLFETLFSESVQDADIEDLATPENIRKDLVRILSKSSKTLVSKPEDVVDGWLADIDILNAPTPADRMLKADLLKREIFSYLAAERLLEIKNNMADPNYRPGKSPLTISWPQKFDDTTGMFESVDPGALEAYEYIRSEYTTDKILSLIGVENALPDGFLKDYAAKYPDTVSGGAADFGDLLLDWALRTDATEYLAHDLKVYRDALLEDPSFEALDQTTKDHYKAYINTLLVNVMLESAVEEKGITPSDLQLTIANAKRYLYNLRTRRGETPQVDMVKNQSDLLGKFTVADKQKPDLLQEVIDDTRGIWHLRGKEPPVVAGAATPNTPGSAVPGNTVPTAPGTAPNAAPAVNPSVMNGLLNMTTADMAFETKRDEILTHGLQNPQGNEVALRKKFDDTIAANANVRYNTPGNKTALHQYLRGVSAGNIKTIEDTILGSISRAGDLDDLLTLRADPQLTPTERLRTQHALDRAAVKVLEGIAVELGGADPATLDTNPHRQSWTNDLTKLYAAADDVHYDLLRDTVSFALEFVQLKGDYSGANIARYNSFLQSMGLPGVPTVIRPPTWTERALGKDNLAADRFQSRGTLRTGDIENALQKRLRKAKAAL